MTHRATLRLNSDCDNACRFCAQAGSVFAPGELDRLHKDLERLSDNADELSFIGGEPSLSAELPSLIASAKSLGFSAIGIQTNGRRLAADDALFNRLIDAGLSDLHLSLHGPAAPVHDFHTGRSGSYAATLDLLTRAGRKGLTTVVSTTITRSNFRQLRAMPALLKRRGVAAWLLEVVRPFGRGAGHASALIPRFGMALPYALHALEQARRHALSAWIRGAPLCTLGPFASVALSDEPRSFPTPCEGCANRSSCTGADPRYLEIFGPRELSPCALRKPLHVDRGRARLIRMFVGVGERSDDPLVLSSKLPAQPGDTLDL